MEPQLQILKNTILSKIPNKGCIKNFGGKAVGRDEVPTCNIELLFMLRHKATDRHPEIECSLFRGAANRLRGF